MRSLFLALCAAFIFGRSSNADFRFEQVEGGLNVFYQHQPIAEYRYTDPKIPRPYFSNVHALDGTRLTRTFPPIPGIDAMDHDSLHPGIWLAFGDLNGVDFWRNKARVEHIRFSSEPIVLDGRFQFAVEEKYIRKDDTEICKAISDYVFEAPTAQQKTVVVLRWKTQIKSDVESLVFGNQHEMGLGFRMATPLIVKGGAGSILGSHGGKNEKGNWGKVAQWWDYSGAMEDRIAGILAIVEPASTRPVWVHARDYGFLALNPTGVPDKPDDSSPSHAFEVAKGDTLTLAYTLVFHASPKSEVWNPSEWVSLVFGGNMSAPTRSP